MTCTTDVETKLLPVTVSVNPGPPAVALDGEMPVNEGAGLLTVNGRVLVPEPSGLITPMARVPAEAMSLAGIAAVTCVPLTNVVVRFEPLTWTKAPFTKFEPLAVSVKAGPPAVALLGEMLVRDGGGLVTVKVTAADVPPPGVFTVTESEPGVLESAAGKVAVNCVALTKVVLRFTPFTWTTDVLTKFEPVAVKVTGPLPATALVGEIAFKVGGGGADPVTVKLTGLDCQGPSLGLDTVSVSVPAWATSLLVS